MNDMMTKQMRGLLPSLISTGLLLALAVLAGGCDAGGDEPVVGSESHWLEPCEATRDCPSGQSCQCGICTVSCDDDEDCDAGGEGGICAAHVSLSEECQSALFWAESVCVSECTEEADCDAIDPQLTCTSAGICEREERRMTPVDSGTDTDASSGDADVSDAGVELCEEPVAPLTVDGPVELDLAIELVDVAGTVTLEGAQLPDTQVNGAERLEVIFEDQNSPAVTAVSVGEDGPANFSATLTRSVYDVYVETSTGRYNEEFLPVGQRVMVQQGWEATSDEPLDIDLEVFEVSGTMTLDGGALPDASNSRGEVRFVRRDESGTSAVDLGTTGTGSYNIKLFEGSYDVRYVQQVGTPGLPRGGAHAAEALVVNADSTFDFDVQTTEVDFDMRVDGQPVQDNTLGGSRGDLVLWDRESDLERRIDLGATGPVQRSETLYVQTLYDVYLESAPASDQNVLPADQRVLIESELGYSPNAVVDTNLATHEISGEVTVNGAQWADALGDDPRGWLIFVESGRELELSGPSSPDAILEEFPSAGVTLSGPATFSRRLFGNTSYDIYVISNEFRAQDALPPEQMGRLRVDVDPSSVDSLTLDVQTTRVTGEVTIGGEELPPTIGDTLPRGSVRFRLRGVPLWPATTSADVDIFGPGEFDVTLMGGSYDVEFDAEPGIVDAVVGLDRYRFETDWTPVQTLDLDLPAVHDVGGSLTIDTRVIDEHDAYAWVELHPRDERYISTSFRLVVVSRLEAGARVAQGAGGEAMTGEYDVEFVTRGEDRQEILPPNVRGAPLGMCRR